MAGNDLNDIEKLFFELGKITSYQICFEVSLIQIPCID